MRANAYANANIFDRFYYALFSCAFTYSNLFPKSKTIIVLLCPLSFYAFAHCIFVGFALWVIDLVYYINVKVAEEKEETVTVHLTIGLILCN